MSDDNNVPAILVTLEEKNETTISNDDASFGAAGSSFGEKECAKNNKSRKSKTSRNIPPATLPLTVSPSSSFVSPSPPSASSAESLVVKQSLSKSSVKILDILVKFQTCLLMLSNTVLNLHESLKLILPGKELTESSTCLADTPSSSTTILDKMCPLQTAVATKLCQSHVSLENHNTTKPYARRDGAGSGDTTQKSDTTLNLSSSESGGLSDTPILPDTERNLKQSPSLFARILSRVLKYIGLLLALFASICMSLVTLVVKFMEDYHPVSKVIWRLQGVLFPSLLFLLFVKFYQKRSLITWRNGGQDRSTYWRWQILILLVARGVVGCSADIFQYYSLKYLPLADSTVISFSTPIFVCIVAHFVLKEKCGVVPIITAVITLCGVIVIAKPPILTGEEEMSNNVLLGNILAVMCMICGTLTTVLMRYLQHIHFSVTMLALGIFGTMEAFILTIFTGPFELPDKNYETDWLLALFTAGVFFLGQLSMTMALQHEEAGVVSLVRTCDVLFAFVWQVFFLQQEANMYSYIGALIVTSGVCITAVRRWVSDLPERSLIRDRLSFILR